ncbi:MAG: fimbrillin family protein, partial [Candidatus Cryptobacteroides sp.]|nr:fimbrillin family protein [Candidatus Cryptobacteroides sp.]
MKKLSLFLGMALAASLSLTNCAEKIEGPIAPATPAGIPFEISADISTKTTNDGLATKWATGDAINLFHAEAGKTDYVSDNDFKLDATRVGVFKGSLTGTLDASKSYDWYAIYPYNQALETPANNATTAKYFYVGGRSDTPAVQNGNNSTSHLVERYAPLWGKAANVPSNEKPSMIMQHLASVVKVKVTNTTEKPLTVNSVAFTSTEPIVGQFYIDVTGTAVEYTTGDGLFNSSTASLTVKGATPLAKGESAVYYIPIKPHTAASGSILKISVNGYEKPLTLPKDVTFTAGKIKTLVFNFDKTQYTFDFSSKDSIDNMGIKAPTTGGVNIGDKTLVV